MRPEAKRERSLLLTELPASHLLVCLRGPGRAPGVLHPGKQFCGTELGGGIEKGIKRDNGRWSRDEALRHIASPLAAVGSGADAGMLVGWSGTDRGTGREGRGAGRPQGARRPRLEAG